MREVTLCHTNTHIPLGIDGVNHSIDAKDAIKIHLGFLENSLHRLEDGRVGTTIVQEVCDWIRSDACDVFSFRLCCRLAGVNPIRLVESLEERGLVI